MTEQRIPRLFSLLPIYLIWGTRVLEKAAIQSQQYTQQKELQEKPVPSSQRSEKKRWFNRKSFWQYPPCSSQTKIGVTGNESSTVTGIKDWILLENFFPWAKTKSSLERSWKILEHSTYRTFRDVNSNHTQNSSWNHIPINSMGSMIATAINLLF